MKRLPLSADLPRNAGRRLGLCALVVLTTLIAAPAVPALAASPSVQASPEAEKVSQDSKDALARLYAKSPKARQLGERSRAILVFPRILKAGLMVGGEGGEGALIVDGKTVGFFRIGAASVGFQAGAQTFSYALFFVTPSSLDYLKKSNGWAIGTGPSVVVVDEGFAKTLNTTTLSQDVYAFAFGQQGLMAGAGIEGSKISRTYPGR